MQNDDIFRVCACQTPQNSHKAPVLFVHVAHQPCRRLLLLNENSAAISQMLIQRLDAWPSYYIRKQHMLHDD